MRINREHKDRLFKFIFQEKEKLLQLYNALNGTEYNNPEDLEIVTLEDVIYMRMKNDISFVLDYEMNLFEHQSTDNANMPLRGLLYFARQYEKYIAENEYNIFGSKRIPIPRSRPEDSRIPTGDRGSQTGSLLPPPRCGHPWHRSIGRGRGGCSGRYSDSRHGAKVPWNSSRGNPPRRGRSRSSGGRREGDS